VTRRVSDGLAFIFKPCYFLAFARSGLLNGVAGEASKVNELKLIVVEFEQDLC